MATSMSTQNPGLQSTSTDEQPNTPSEDVIGIGVAITLILTVVLFFMSPWAPRSIAGSTALNRYAPVTDGNSLLLARYDGAGNPLGWQSENTAVLAKVRALAGQIRIAPREMIERYFGGTDAGAVDLSARLERFANVDFLETHISRVDTEGSLKTSSSIYVRSASGEFLVSQFQPDLPNPEVVFDPPAQSLPADLRSGNTWITTGTLSTHYQYAYMGVISATGAYSTTTGQFDDCVQVDAALSLFLLSQVVSVQHTQSWYCASVGMVEQKTLDSQGVVTSRDLLVSSNQLRPTTDRLPATKISAPADMSQESLPAVDIGAWRLTRIGRMGLDVAAGSSTIPPVWIPATPPVVLVAAYNGDLAAFDAHDLTGVPLWQFHTRGAIYSPPGYDATRNRIYFGSTDKHLYALDTRGLFLWSYETGDSIASRPVVISGTIIFGSEDRYIYGLNADTGDLRWKVKTGAAVVSSPAALTLPGAGDEMNVLVVIGSDDGGIYALDPPTGAQHWLFATGAAIEAPLVTADGMVYAASRDSTLYAIDGSSGDSLWGASAHEVLRNAPLVGHDAIYVVDDARRLHAFSRADGKQLWVIADSGYVGTPVMVGQTLLVATRDDRVQSFDLNGQYLGEWSISDVISSGDSNPSNDLGLTLVGGSINDYSIWFADDHAFVRRLGTGLNLPTK